MWVGVHNSFVAVLVVPCFAYKGSSLSDVIVKLYIISMFVILNFITYMM